MCFPLSVRAFKKKSECLALINIFKHFKNATVGIYMQRILTFIKQGLARNKYFLNKTYIYTQVTEHDVKKHKLRSTLYNAKM